MCGIIGTLAKTQVNQDIYDALIMIQHRGQDAAGIMTCEGNKVFLRKGNGLVRETIRASHILLLPGNMGLGHVRYPTAGTPSPSEAQPFYVNSPYGLCIVHNGNLTNSEELKQDLLKADRRHLNTDSDSEVLLNVFAHELQAISEQKSQFTLTPDSIFQAVAAVHKRCRGAYAVVMMIVGYGIVAFRDKHGIRPLCWGSRQSKLGTEYMVASESVALDALGYKVAGDVLPGEAMIMTLEGGFVRQQCVDSPLISPCLFEYVYLSRPDSIINGISVYEARLNMGEKLAEKLIKEFAGHDIDVVVPIPDTSRTAALALARSIGVPYLEGFVKNSYIGRTFIMPGQAQRKKSVKQKLNAIKMVFNNRNVLLVDDSIVRGTTSRKVIEMAREAGAKKVYFASVAPEVAYPNVYGIDMPAASELIGHKRNAQEIAKIIGADWIIFQELSALYQAVQSCNKDIKHFEDCVFSGHYLTNDVNADYLACLEAQRNDRAKAVRVQLVDNQVVETHNSN